VLGLVGEIKTIESWIEPWQCNHNCTRRGEASLLSQTPQLPPKHLSFHSYCRIQYTMLYRTVHPLNLFLIAILAYSSLRCFLSLFLQLFSRCHRNFFLVLVLVIYFFSLHFLSLFSLLTFLVSFHYCRNTLYSLLLLCTFFLLVFTILAQELESGPLETEYESLKKPWTLLWLFSKVSYYTNKNYYNTTKSPRKHLEMMW